MRELGFTTVILPRHTVSSHYLFSQRDVQSHEFIQQHIHCIALKIGRNGHDMLYCYKLCIDKNAVVHPAVSSPRVVS